MDDEAETLGATDPRDSSAAATSQQAEGRPATSIDVERLADKVYQLLRDEVRQARSRGADHVQSRRR